MFTQRHLFIIGAGASVPYGFPTGSDLKTNAIEILEPGNGAEIGLLAQIAPQYNIEVSVLFEFRKLLQNNSDDISIDAVIQKISDPRKKIDVQKMVIAAKLVTALLIAKYESKENLQVMDGNWCKKLLDYMYESSNRSLDGFFAISERLIFVTFNYDRTLEQCMLTGICQKFDESEDIVAPLLRSKFQFIHPHGEVGSLLNKNDSTFREFGGEWSNPDAISKSSQKIKFITDELTAEDNETFAKIKTLIRDFDKVHFVGFGYNTDNMNRLGFDRTFTESIGFGKIYGTLKGKSPQERRIISESYKHTDNLAALPDDFSGDRDGALAYIMRAPFN